MTLARLLAAAMTFCSLAALAQNQRPESLPAAAGSASHQVGAPYFGPAAATRVEPWKILPSNPPDSSPENRMLNGLRSHQQPSESTWVHFPRALVLESQGDTVCYAIRSMKVARDSMDSDSTHLVGTSTCQPSQQYQVKSAVLDSDSSGR